jgi:hypothetical protein
MTKLKMLTTAATLLVSLASAPVFAQPVRAHHASQNASYDNSGWNGYNAGGSDNTWFDGRNYRSDRMPLGEDIATDAASRR